MKRNRIILSIFGILLIVYLFLYANEFEIRARTEFWIILTEFVVALTLIILLLFLKTKWWFKLLSISGLTVGIIFGLPKTGLWKYSLKKYVTKEKTEYIKLANQIDKFGNENLTYVSCYNNQINSRPKLDSLEIKPFKESLCNFIK